MLDINYIREHPEEIKRNIKNRGLSLDLDHFLKLDHKRSQLIAKIDTLRSKKNQLKKKPTAKEKSDLLKNKKQLESLESEYRKIENEYTAIWYAIPNITHPAVKVGNENENPVLEIVIPPKKTSFQPLDHIELSKRLDLIDFDRAAKVSGSKFYYLKNELAILEFALISYALETVIKHGFTPMITPDLARGNILNGLGYNPRDDSSQIYNIENSDLSLIGTAEITVGGFYAQETIKEEELPKKFVAFSHCFRTEAGTYSKYSKGIFRVHQFSKVEMFIYTTKDEAEKYHRLILDIEKELFTGLGVPFRIIDHTTGDLGTPAFRTYDLEVWLPGKINETGKMGDWAEITSTSNCTDYQSRGLNIKYQKNSSGDKQFVYMLNGTAIPTTRAIIAIMENFQTEDGEINIPKVLHKYTGFKKIKSKS